MKISTTVSPETHKYLEELVDSGRAATLADAIDQTVGRARKADSINLLAEDTAAYFQALGGASAKEEARLEKAVGQMAGRVDFDE